MFFNTKTYLDACLSIFSTLSNMYMNMFVEIDVNKCWFGFLGVFIDDPFDCEWQEYGIADVVNVGLRQWDQEWMWLP